MPDQSVVHIGENSPEYVALRLMHEIFKWEGKSELTRSDILSTYVDCLAAVKSGYVKPVPR